MNQTKNAVETAIPLHNLKPISEKFFLSTFGIEENPLRSANDDEDEYDFHDHLIDHHENASLKLVQKTMTTAPRCIWTLLDIKGQDVLVSGYHTAKRQGYQRLGHIISKHPINDGVEMFVPLSKALP